MVETFVVWKEQSEFSVNAFVIGLRVMATADKDLVVQEKERWPIFRLKIL